MVKESGLYDYRNRVYSPDLGRFLQSDPIRFDAGDVNLYRYCGNNGANLIDPEGLSPSCGNQKSDEFRNSSAEDLKNRKEAIKKEKSTKKTREETRKIDKELKARGIKHSRHSNSNMNSGGSTGGSTGGGGGGGHVTPYRVLP